MTTIDGVCGSISTVSSGRWTACTTGPTTVHGPMWTKGSRACGSGWPMRRRRLSLTWPTRARAFPWGHRFGLDWEKAQVESAPDRNGPCAPTRGMWSSCFIRC